MTKAAPKKRSTNTKSPKPRRTTEQIMNALLASAHQEFQENGYRHSKVSSIAERAGVTEAQIYRYFESKSALFLEAVFEPLNNHILSFSTRHFSETEERGSSSYKKLHEARRIYMREMLSFIEKNSHILFSLIANEHADSASNSHLKPIPSLQKYFDMASKMGANTHKPDAVLNNDLLVRISFSTLLATELFKDWLFPEGLADEDQIKRAVIEFVSKGLS